MSLIVKLSQDAVDSRPVNSGVRFLSLWNLMNKYRALINGENFLLNFDGQLQKVGFYVTRVVYVQNPAEAELAAVNLVREDSRLKDNVLNERDDPPMLYADETEEIEESEGEENVDTGFSWFTDGET